MPTRIAIVEDNQEVLKNWARLVNATPGFQCVAACGTGEAALEQLPAWQPDMVLMDINLPGISGIECVARLKPVLNRTQFLMITAYGDNERVFQALQAGASGYLLKRTSPPELVAAIKEMLTGGAPMTSEIARLVVEKFRQPAAAPSDNFHLTSRELEVLVLLAQGYANMEIATQLVIGPETVRTHLKNIYGKLHVRSRTGATAKYLRSM